MDQLREVLCLLLAVSLANEAARFSADIAAHRRFCRSIPYSALQRAWTFLGPPVPVVVASGSPQTTQLFQTIGEYQPPAFRSLRTTLATTVRSRPSFLARSAAFSPGFSRTAAVMSAISSRVSRVSPALLPFESGLGCGNEAAGEGWAASAARTGALQRVLL